MKIKLGFVAILMVFFVVCTLNQAKLVAAATTSGTPLTSPVTAPITPPIIPPVTNLSNYIRGHVQVVNYKYVWNRFYFTVKVTINPLPNIPVVAQNTKTAVLTTTKTDKNGNFSFYLKDGTYRVYTLQGIMGTSIVNLNKSDVNNLLFSQTTISF